MPQIFKFALRITALAGLIAAVAPALAGDRAGAVQLAFHADSQTANLPVGTIRLRVIDQVGGQTLKEPIEWRAMTDRRDGQGRRHQVAEVTAVAPELAMCPAAVAGPGPESPPPIDWRDFVDHDGDRDHVVGGEMCVRPRYLETGRAGGPNRMPAS